MNGVDRRTFLRLLGGTGSALLALHPLVSCTKKTTTSARVIVVGGGFGGATCSKYLNKFDPNLDISLIEPVKRFTTCPFSNMVMSGLRELDTISHSYDAHIRRGIKIVNALVTSIDPVKRIVALNNGKSLNYDRLVLSPGIDFKWDMVQGMKAADAEIIPHAWQGGPQTTLLKNQITSMADGDVFIIAPPGNPFRCPPGPYERVSMVAHYLKQHKPKSKILILDAKSKFSKQPLFMQGWEKLYPGMIEWVAGDAGGRIESIDVGNRTLLTEGGDKHKGSVVNFIPPQKAGAIAHIAGLTNDSGWCPVDQRTFESTNHPGIYVIGDSSIAGEMPKSGFAANSQGKVCAAAIVSSIHEQTMPYPSYVNTCYSLVSPDYGISVAAVYRFDKDKGIYKVKESGGVSPMDADAAFRAAEANFASGWYDSITSDTFG